MNRIVPVALLVALWLLAWGAVTVANVLSGTFLAVLLLVAFPSTRRTVTRRFRPVATLRLVLHVLGQLVVSNILVAREILARRSRIRTGVVAYEVQHPTDDVTSLLANIIALSPGTMTVDVTENPTVIYLHVLLLADVDEAREDVAELEHLVVAAIGHEHIEPRAHTENSQSREGREVEP